MDCVFCSISKGEFPSHQIYEDDKCIAFLDINPATKGQSLIIPKVHEDYIFKLDNETYHHLFSIAKKISIAIDKSLNPKRTCLVVEGFLVPHVHIRLHPCYEEHLEFKPMKNKPSEEEFKEIAKEIKKHL